MKKNYEVVKINVISLDNEDVITTSNTASRGSTFFGGSYGDGDDTGIRTQDF